MIRKLKIRPLCTFCNKRTRLRLDGKLWRHGSWVINQEWVDNQGGVAYAQYVHCEGSVTTNFTYDTPNQTS